MKRKFQCLAGCLAMALLIGAPFGAGPTGAQTTPTAHGGATGSRNAADAKTRAAAANYDRLPLQFEVNRGQAPEPVRFLSRGKGYSLFLTPSEAVLMVHDATGTNPQHLGASHQPPATNSVVEMKLVGANSRPGMTARKALPGHVNYLIGSDRSKWRRNVPTFAQASYSSVYPGIDLLYYGNQGRLEYDFVVAPGADPARIALGFKGANGVRLNRNGDLVLPMKSALSMRWRRPVAYQTVNGKRILVASRYIIQNPQSKVYCQVAFALGRYDRSRPLVIDPTLVYSTFLDSPTVSGTGDGGVTGVTVDSAGCAFVTGSTVSADFPVTSGAYQQINKGFQSTTYQPYTITVSNVFVSKLSPDGRTLLYSTYLGGTGGYQSYTGLTGDTAKAIALDDAGSAYVTGWTYSGDFPVTPGSYRQLGNLDYTDPVTGGQRWEYCSYGFLSKLSADGSDLVYSTYFGAQSVNGTEGDAVVVDASHNAYVTGFTQSLGYPITPGAPFPGATGWSPGAGGTGFLTKFNASGSGLIYSTFIPGPCSALAIDPAGNAYVAASTWSPVYPTTPNAFQTTITPNPTNPNVVPDAFVLKLDPAGTTILYSTLIGGTGFDYATSLAVDAQGCIYVAGWTGSADFPTTPSAYMNAVSPYGGYNYWLAKFDPNAAPLPGGPGSLVFSTYFGTNPGKYFDGASPKMVLADDGSIVLSGTTTTYWIGYGFPNQLIPVTPDALQPVFGGAFGVPLQYDFGFYPPDVFLMVMNPSGTKVTYASYFGGDNPDVMQSMARGADGDIYISGATKSPDFPVTPGAFQQAFKGTAGTFLSSPPGRSTGFVARFHLSGGKSPVPVITGGLPAIYGPGDGVTPRQVTRTITGTGVPGAIITITVKDPLHPNSGDNFVHAPIIVGADGTWSGDLTLFDCDPEVDITQTVGGGGPSDPVIWSGPVDGTPPHFLNGGPTDGIDLVGGGGTADVHLIGGASDAGSFVPGDAVGYEWRLYDGADYGSYTVVGGGGDTLDYVTGPGDYYFELAATDGAGNVLIGRCHHTVKKNPCSVRVDNASLYWNETGALTGAVLDGMGNAIPGATLHFTVNGADAGDGSSYTAAADAGGYTIGATFGGNAQYVPASGTGKLNILLRPTAIAGADIIGAPGATITLPGALGDVRLNGAPAPGTLTWKVNGQPASNPYTVGLPPGVYPVDADFAGNNHYAPSHSTFKLTVPTPPSIVNCGVGSSSLWPPNHDLVNVNLSYTVVPGTYPIARKTVVVYSNEPDLGPDGDDNFSPDAKGSLPGQLRLRSERGGQSAGRVYLVVITAVDTMGNTAVCCHGTVTVPHDQSKASLDLVASMAASAAAYTEAHNGTPPAGYVKVGDGPVVGPKQ